MKKNLLFTPSFLKHKVNNRKDQMSQTLDEKKIQIEKWTEILKNNPNLMEQEARSTFRDKILNQVLGYSVLSSSEYHLKDEYHIKGAGRTDFALGFFKKNKDDIVKVVGELKAPKENLDAFLSRKDRKSPVDQGLEYLHNADESAQFLIVSNMNELRLYRRGIKNRYRSFFFVFDSLSLLEENRTHLLDEKDEFYELRVFLYLLGRENLLIPDTTGKSLTERLLEDQGEKEKEIGTRFYTGYKTLRENIFDNLRKSSNVSKEKKREREEKEKELLGLVEKFLDQILFCAFCEDDEKRALLQPKILTDLIGKRTKENYNPEAYSIYEEVKPLFQAINHGNSELFQIEEGYNGGLFQENEKLNALKIPNSISIFKEIHEGICSYNFGNEEILNTGILGHIFEQSISDLEEIHAGLEGKV